MKRRSLTLIEIAVALPLIALLFSFLLSSLYSHLKLGKDNAKLQAQVLEIHYFKKRLQKILHATTHHKEVLPAQFQPQSLSFFFNNYFSQNPLASGKVYASLFFENNALHFWLYNLKDLQTPFRKEVLVHNLENAHFSYEFEKRVPLGHKDTSTCDYTTVSSSQEILPKNWVFLSVELTQNKTSKTYHFNLRRSWKETK